MKTKKGMSRKGLFRVALWLTFLVALLSAATWISVTIGSAQPAADDPPSTQRTEGESPRWLDRLFPDSFDRIRVMGIDLVQWAGLIVLLVVAYLVALFATRIIVRMARTVASRTRTTWDDALIKYTAGPLRLALVVFLFFMSSHVLELGDAQRAVNVLCKLLAVVTATWLALRTVDIVGAVVQAKSREKGRAEINTLLPIGRRVTKVFLVIVAGLSLLQNLGFNITGLITGLGVGGLAVALAAQKTVENLIGGFMVVADRPVKVGDFCRVGEHTGIVEEIGTRSTRIRTLDRTLLTIPNAEFSTVRIENYAQRDKMRLHTLIGLGYDTSPDQIRYVLVEVRKMLHAHPRVLPDPCRVRLVNFGAYSLDLEVFAFVDTRDFNEFLAIREDIYLRIIDIVNGSGTYFAYPSQTLYLGRDAGRDLERTRAAEETVRGWREQGELPFPNFAPDTVASIDNTLDYPPAGSVETRREGG